MPLQQTTDIIATSKKLFWRDDWCNKECKGLYGGEHRFMIHAIFEVPEE